MTSDSTIRFLPRGDAAAIEGGAGFQPKFGVDGLISAVVSDRITGTVLMFAHMNAEALRLTIDTGTAHFWSRSRRKLWKKGEESGNLLRVAEIRVDCDQDALWLIVDIAGEGVACHTGRRSCFYRRLIRTETGDVALTFDEPASS